MEPVTILTYIVVSHYGCYIITNFYDYLKFQSNFRSVQNEISSLKYQVESLETQLHYCTKKILDKIRANEIKIKTDKQNPE
jgi:cell division protein FtsL